jgi:hypothetical protein
MAYKQPYNSPNLKIGKERTMKVRIKPGKEGELSKYAMDHITKTNKRGKVTIEVPKSEMNLSKSKLFNTSKPKWTSNPNADSPSSQSTAKGFKKQRNKDRILKAAAGLIIAKGSGILRVDPPEEELSKKEKRKAKNYTVEVTGVEEKKPFKGYSKKDLRDPNKPKNKNNKNSCGKTGLFNTKVGNCMGAGSWHR